MGIAHFGVGLAVKPRAEKLPLWILLVASEFLDILSFLFLSLGVEKMSETEITFQGGVQFLEVGNVAWSHGLLMSAVWSLFGVGIGFLVTREWRSGGILGLVVFSHWVLDLLVHPPDLPVLFEGSRLLGIGLWSGQPGFTISMILEFLLFGGGLAIYLIWQKKIGKEGR